MRAKKRFLTGLLVLIIALFLPGCGFHLRGSSQLPTAISPMYIQGHRESLELQTALIQMMKYNNIQIAERPATATSLLKITHYRSNRRVLSVEGSGNVTEYELHESTSFELVSATGSSLVLPQTVSAMTTYLNPEIDVLAKQHEEATLQNDLRQDLATQIMRRLQAQL